MLENELARLHATIEGRVQGVGFRYFVQENAVALGLYGWVRNRWNRKVEVMAEGQRSTLERFLNLLRRGPRAASVSGVEVEWLEPRQEYDHFFVRRTG